MPIDAYSSCPGGTGKKIKFCCGNDSLPELQNLDRMFEGEQYLACLEQIDRLLAKEPGHERACLLAMRCRVLEVMGQRDAARAAAMTFLERHPENSVALSEAALSEAESDILKAFGYLQRALRIADGKIEGRTYQAMGVVAALLYDRGFPLPGLALTQFLVELSPDDKRARQMFSLMSRDANTPLLLRDDPAFSTAPADAPWKNRLVEIMRGGDIGDWRTAADRAGGLAAEMPDVPALWRNAAILRGWAADIPGCIKAWRRYAALRIGDADGLEDAVEAEATAMFLSNDPLGDHEDLLHLLWNVQDADRAQELLLSSPSISAIPFDPAQFSGTGAPPPKGAYAILDRPLPASAENLNIETIPQVLGHLLLFGRETDREARLEVVSGVRRSNREAVCKILREAVDEVLEAEPKEDVIGRRSISHGLLEGAWHPPRDASPEQVHALAVRYVHDVFVERWPDMKLGVLDGRSPREAVGDAAARARVLAAILVLEHWAEQLYVKIDFNALRERLGLPTHGPIEVHGNALEDLPVVRLARVDAALLSDDDLLSAYQRAQMFAVRSAVRKFAEAIVDRPSFAGSEERLLAYAALARTDENLDLAMKHIDCGRREAEAKGHSSASWDLMELSVQFARHDGQEAVRLVEHIQRNHIEEPGVGDTLTQILMSVGLLRPDGTPAFDPNAAEPAMAGEADDAAMDAPGKLWTPDGVSPSGGGKLWTPE